jgi:sugar phosphate isomerase/epimerase
MYKRLQLPEVFRLAADLGYLHLELSFRDDLDPLFEAPAATSETIRVMRRASRETGVKVASMMEVLYCVPHAFFMGEGMADMIRYAASLLTHVHVADTLNHRAGLRYVVNPLGAPVRVHQHLNIGESEIDWEIFFGTLAEVGFGGILTSSVFAWEDRAIESSRFMRKRIQFYLDKYMLT